MKPVRLKKNEDRRIRAGHLWVFSNEIDVAATPLTDFVPGEIVRLEASSGRPLGLAMINPNALICARILSRDAADKPGKEFFTQRLRQALDLRQRLYDQPYYRLVFSEGDLLPGLIIDRYGDGLVLQVTTAGMEALLPTIHEALEELLNPAWMLLKNDTGIRELEGLTLEVKPISGEPPETGEVVEGSCRFTFPLAAGQKTGWFYDQRENRLSILPLCKDARVLDAFSYVGGLGVAAAKAGAREVFLVDSSAQALDFAEKNAENNHVADERLALVHGDCLETLDELRQNGERFDLVCLDPPAFIKRRKDHAKGLAAYQRLNRLAVDLLTPGGFLLTCSCSRHLAREELAQAALKAVNGAHREAQIIRHGRQGLDHPAHPAMPETEYLKTMTLRVF